MSIKVSYIYSACIIIETEDCKILCDPWFTEGIYDGSWFHFPKVDDPVKLIREVDFIYISHTHQCCWVFTVEEALGIKNYCKQQK